MKLLNKFALAAIVAAALTNSSAFAQTKIYLTGSTAFRSATTNAIDALLGTGTTKASDNATFTSANAVTWSGGSVGGTAVAVKVSWSGSASGVQSVAGQPHFTVRFLPDSATGTANPDPRNTSNPAEPVTTPHIAMSDVFQAATPFNGTLNGVTYPALKDSTVGVVSFTFAASQNFPLGSGASPISTLSMTRQIAQSLFFNGLVPLSQFTGSTTDRDRGVFATGRDIDSGTRLTAMAETLVGVNTLLTQYKPTTSAGAVTAVALYPRTTINGVDTQQAGNSGESSGSSLRAFLQNTMAASVAETIDGGLTGTGSPAGSDSFLVTYLGVSDYNSVSTGSAAVRLRYGGYDFSQQAIIDGNYTFWGFEHLDTLTTISGVASTFATNLATQISGTTSAGLSPNVNKNDLKVSRASDGATVFSTLH